MSAGKELAFLFTQFLFLGVAGWTWSLPPGFPAPRVPADNPMSAERLALGRHLFYDPRLSGNGTQACSSCHQPARAFTDGRARALGSTGESHPRSAMSLANVAYSASLTWADPGKRALEEQMLVPMTNEHPVEMGMKGRENEILARLMAEPVYAGLFPKAFPEQRDAITLANVRKAIACFERTLLSGDSPYDRFVWRDDPTALSESARRGMRLFFSDRLACSKCHAGFTFSGPVAWQGDGSRARLLQWRARYRFRPGRSGALHRFAPGRRPRSLPGSTLRNIGVTGLMHRPLRHPGRRRRAPAEEPQGPNRTLLKGFAITPEECDLIAFLKPDRRRVPADRATPIRPVEGSSRRAGTLARGWRGGARRAPR
jgi:hypothetical protein